MRNLTILFLHHNNDWVTRQRYRRLTELNPNVPVVPLSHRATNGIAERLDSAELMPEYAIEDGWHGTDIMLYAWFLKGRSEMTRARRYIVCEWDMFFTEPMVEFFGRNLWAEEL